MKDEARLKEISKYEEEVQKAWDRLSPENVPEDWDDTLFIWYDAEWKAFEEKLYNRFSYEDDTETKKKLETSANLVKFSVDVAVLLICALIVILTMSNGDIIGTTVAILGTVVLILCNHLVTSRINKSEYLRYVAECKVKSQILKQRQVNSVI